MQPIERAIDRQNDAQTTLLGARLSTIRAKYNAVYAILAPPRCASTALARVFWEHPLTLYYCHEPFDVTYHKHGTVRDALSNIEHAQPLVHIKKDKQATGGNLVLKEMTFQVGQNFPVLLSLVTHPLLFLLRNPAASIWSRMQKLQEGGENPNFPPVESGWEDLWEQVMYCQGLELPYLIIDAADFRNAPSVLLKKVFTQLNLSFSEDLLCWRPVAELSLGNLAGTQDHWYQRVLGSDSIQPENEVAPDISCFPEAEGMRNHVRKCLHIYETLCADARRVRL
jgi:hypothetical protein